MRAELIAIALTVAASSAFAGEPRVFIDGTAGVTAPSVRSRDIAGDVGVRLGSHVSVIGGIGQFGNLEGSASAGSALDLAAKLASDDTGVLNKAGTTLPALYSLGGVKVNGNRYGRVTPYVLGGAGIAHLEPGAEASDNEALYAIGSGVGVQLDRHLALDGGYRYSRIAGSSPINTQSVTVGLGYRF